MKPRNVATEDEDRFRAMFDQAAAGMAHVALDGRLLRVNSKLCKMLGYSPEELTERRAQDLRHPDAVEALLCQFQAMRDGVLGCSTREERCLRRDGSLFWVTTARSLVRGPSGPFVTEVIIEIDRRKRAEEALERALAGERAARIRVELAEARIVKLQAVTSHLSRALTPAQVADVVLTQGLPALFADAGYVALVGDDGTIEVIRAPGYPEEIVERYRRFPVSTHLPAAECIRTGKLLVLESPDAVRKAGFDLSSLAWARTWVCIPMTAGERTLGALGLTYVDACRFSQEDRDFMITLAQQCAQAMDRARLYEAEQRARRLREEVLAIAAHDLRNPLSAILLSAALLEEPPENAEAGQRTRARAQSIQRNARRAAELLHELLDAATIEAGELKLEIESCAVDALVAEVLDMLAPIAEEKGIRLRARPLESPLEIACDRRRILQVLSNLAGNALKFTPKGNEITIRAEREGSSVRIFVSDTGAGIKPEDVPHLFDRYWHARATRSAGTGLGLYIVKGIVEAHGGEISVDSRLGVGTTFSFSVHASTPGSQHCR